MNLLLRILDATGRFTVPPGDEEMRALVTRLGWFLGKSMLETRGLFWVWFIHFWQDVLIFIFLAVGSVMPGG